MINDFIGDARTRILQHFPERQLYMRSGGEVKYYLFSTRLQLAITAGLSLMALWCLYTMINLLIGNNPLSTPGQRFKQQQVNYERQLADSRAKEEKSRLLLAEQRTNFEQMARGFEEKHQTLSQIMDSTDTVVTSIPIVQYADNRVLMAPTSRNSTPRKARRMFEKTSSLTTGLDIDDSLTNLNTTQNEQLLSAETSTLDRIEYNRALIQHTDLNIDTVLEENPFGKGGPYLPTQPGDLNENGFLPRTLAIQARLAEVDMLENAVKSLPIAQPVPADSYRTSGFGLRRDPFTKRPTQHQGIDFGGQRNTPILATAAGTVTYVGRNGAYGKTVEIDHGHGFKTRYAHLNKTLVKRGQKIAKGEKIAGMGSTGRSTA
ncbi:MAG: M23 family metallopeptidase, partial [Litorimonas sp.]